MGKKLRSIGPALQACLGLIALFATASITAPSPADDVPFLRGDANADGKVNISDPIAVLGRLYRGEADPPCPDAADADDSGAIEIGDAVRILGYLFLAQAPLPEPFARCGPDATEDALVCGDDLPCR